MSKIIEKVVAKKAFGFAGKQIGVNEYVDFPVAHPNYYPYLKNGIIEKVKEEDQKKVHFVNSENETDNKEYNREKNNKSSKKVK